MSSNKSEDLDTESSECSDFNDLLVEEVIQKLRHPIFRRKYGVTVNVQPTRYINKRQWKKYTHDQQIKILTRMEASIRRRTPSIKLIELHFEVCPTLKNVHFHALYEMPVFYVSELEAQWSRLVGNIITSRSKTDQLSLWRYLDIKEIKPRLNSDGNPDEADWLAYIRKDEKK